ncbi:type II toxin-antitoxin system Phd/YefM family antitoxin [Gloeothece verrucosa]|uniref:Antitoxin n=1 Tax=Gloeothece verrucosa (strain PCC 7822) TaxID=497965 RepID=E0UNE9_GLOV7|nr:type II toxin-antitoxin system prevent-host-death family antitoxin [Gloeothece verrucosa]ADN18479.1 prevent-host-death family protein [Gloeothece verrucosa PCC 7822]
MKTIDINQAILELSELIEIVGQGEEIIITKNNQPMAKLVSLESVAIRSPLFGSDKGLISLSDDFDEPLDDFKDYT